MFLRWLKSFVFWFDGFGCRTFIFEDEKENVVESKKIYTKPDLRFIVISSVDIITTSPVQDEWEDDNVKDDGWL